jgi:hypothetical protein
MTDAHGRFLTARAQFKDAEAKAQAILAARLGRPLNAEQIAKLKDVYQVADDACTRMLQALEDMLATERTRSA